MNDFIPIAVGILLAYAIGSISFALVLGYLVKGIDIRRHGSGNIGATNVGRILGRGWGVATYFLDFGKGAVAAYALPRLLGGWIDSDWSPESLGLCFGLAAVLGHMFPFYLKFKGGKGVAAGSGVLLVVLPVPTLIAAGIWAASLVVTRYMSLASMLGALSIPISVFVLGGSTTGVLIFTMVLALLVILRHRSNIQRLLAGNENRIGGKKTEGAG